MTSPNQVEEMIRRQFFTSSASGLGGLALGSLLSGDQASADENSQSDGIRGGASALLRLAATRSMDSAVAAPGEAHLGIAWVRTILRRTAGSAHAVRCGSAS